MTLSKSKLDKSIFLKTMSHTEEDVTAEMSLQIDGDGTGDDVLDVLEQPGSDKLQWLRERVKRLLINIQIQSLI